MALHFPELLPQKEHGNARTNYSTKNTVCLKQQINLRNKKFTPVPRREIKTAGGGEFRINRTTYVTPSRKQVFETRALIDWLHGYCRTSFVVQKVWRSN